MSHIDNLNKSQFTAFLNNAISPFMREIKELRSEVNDLKSQLSNRAKEFYSSKELELLLGVSRSTIHNWVTQGKLLKHPISTGKVLFKRSDVEKLINYSKK